MSAPRRSLVGAQIGPWRVVDRFKPDGRSHRWRYVLVHEDTGEVIASKKGYRVLALAHELGVEIEHPGDDGRTA